MPYILIVALIILSQFDTSAARAGGLRTVNHYAGSLG